MNTCDNCQQQWTDQQLLPIRDLLTRVAPGEVMPSGECPDCGALCHANQGHGEPPRVILTVSGGMVQDVYASDPIDLTVVDWDTEGIADEDVIACQSEYGYPLRAIVRECGTFPLDQLNDSSDVLRMLAARETRP